MAARGSPPRPPWPTYPTHGRSPRPITPQVKNLLQASKLNDVCKFVPRGNRVFHHKILEETHRVYFGAGKRHHSASVWSLKETVRDGEHKVQNADSNLMSEEGIEFEEAKDLVAGDGLGSWKPDWTSQKKIDDNAGKFMLVSVAILWGTYTVAVRYLLTQPDPLSVSVFTFVRKLATFGGMLLFLPLDDYLTSPSPTPSNSSLSEEQFSSDTSNDSMLQWKLLLLPALELGLWNFLANYLQAEGLETITATEAGILIQLSAIFVPILSTISGEKLKTSTWAAAILAIIGMIIFSVDFSTVDLSSISTSLYALPEASFTGSKLWGYGILFLCILFYSIFTVRLSKHASKYPPLKLSAAIQAVASVFSLLYLLYDWNVVTINGGDVQSSWIGLGNFQIFAIVFYVSFFCGSLAGIGQSLGQSVVSASESQIFYSTTPLWSSLFAFSLLGENLSPQSYLGGFILLVSVLMATIDPQSLKGK